MKVLFILCLYILLCTASDDSMQATMCKQNSLSLIAKLLPHPLAQPLPKLIGQKAVLAELILKNSITSKTEYDCILNRPQDSVETIESKIRSINDGNFTLSHDAKAATVDFLRKNFHDNKNRFIFFDNFAERHALHSVSVERVKEMILRKK